MPLLVTAELELAGRGNGWTDVSGDVILPLELDYGIQGTGPNDRVASTGYLHFGLRSHEDIEGLYSPNHANKRAGFRMGIRVRLSFTVGSTTVRKFVGKINDIQPKAGIEGNDVSRITAVDWMDEAASRTVSGLSLLENVRGDEAFSALLAVVQEQPNAIEIASIGQDTYRYVFDNTDSESVSVMAELQRLANSGAEYIYIKGDPTTGGVLTYESRTTRGRTTSNVVTFTDVVELTKLEAAQSRNMIANKMRLTIHPREVDAAATSVLYNLRNSIKIQPLTAFRLIGSYYDPLQKAQKVGGRDVFVSSFLVNTESDGSGTDITANFTNDVSYGPNGFSALITNNSTQEGYVTAFVLTGRGIYDYTNVTVEYEDEQSIADNGERVAKIDQPYQHDPAVGSELSQYLVALWKDPSTQVQTAQITCGTNDDVTLLKALLREPSHRIGLVERKTGIDTNNPNASGGRGFFIHRLRYTLIESGKHGALVAEFSLAPVDSQVYWVLEQPGQSEMDYTTRLAFYTAVGHTDTPHIDDHDDVAHVDVPHEDSHTDNPHADAGHADSEHSDVPHSDNAHADSHGDTGHSDVLHSDIAHVDSHSDVAHSDIAHQDTAHGDVPHYDEDHEDVGHADTAHVDTHSDTAHSDRAHADEPGSEPPITMDHTDQHADVSHLDTPHSDTHSDTLHSDIAFQDEDHEDSAHVDSPHSDSHTDNLHQDTHNDTVHSDSSHQDVPHSDAVHADTVHADILHQDAGHSDAAHADELHEDVAHVDTNHSDVPHEDEHDDVTHGDA